MDSEFTCAYCFEVNSIFVDPSGGIAQQYIEDCQVCCRPNLLHCQWDDALETFTAEADPAQ